MGVQNRLAFQKRIDDYSYQVSTEADPRFWFRLVRENDRDIITDYFLGSFAKEDGGRLLSDCYRVLGLTPNNIVVFKDILSGANPADSKALDQARESYAAFGEALLNEFGSRVVDETLEKVLGKFNLVLTAQADANSGMRAG